MVADLEIADYDRGLRGPGTAGETNGPLRVYSVPCTSGDKVHRGLVLIHSVPLMPFGGEEKRHGDLE